MIFRPATQPGMEHIVANLRPEDLREATAVLGDSPEEKLSFGWRASPQVYVAEVDGEPAVAMGLEIHHDGSARPWLFATPRCEEKPLALIKEVRAWTDRWLTRWSPLWNYIDQRNGLHVRWIRLLDFETEFTVDINGHPFLYFQKTSPCASL